MSRLNNIEEVTRTQGDLGGLHWFWDETLISGRTWKKRQKHESPTYNSGIFFETPE